MAPNLGGMIPAGRPHGNSVHRQTPEKRQRPLFCYHEYEGGKNAMVLDISAPETAFAVRVVREAATLAPRIQSGMKTMNLIKGDLSPTTVADYAIQALVAQALEAAFPGEPLVAEERSADLRGNEAMLDTVTRFVRESVPDADADKVCGWIDRGDFDPAGRFWLLDPIDGTKGYLRGGQYAVALALIAGGQVELGVLGCPQLNPDCSPSAGAGVIVAARRGQGAWRVPLSGGASYEPLRVSSCAEAASARLLRSHEAGHTDAGKIAALSSAMGMQAPPVLMDSQAKYAVLAAGHADLLLRMLSPAMPDYKEKIWDQAAGTIVTEEAGGRVTDLDGRPLDFSAGRTLARNRGVVASNGFLHERALKAIAEAG